MAKKKKTESLKKAISKNKQKATDQEKQRLADIDAKWNLYARSLLGETITPDEEAALPDVLESLSISPERVTGDQGDLEKVLHYRNIISEVPPPLDELRARAKSLLEEYERVRRQLKTAGSYEVRRRDMAMRIDAIKHTSPSLWRHLDGLLPPPEPGVEPQPRGHSRIISLFTSPRASPPVDAGDGDPEPLALVESVVAEPEPDPALAAAAAGIAMPDAQAEPVPRWPRPIRRFDSVQK